MLSNISPIDELRALPGHIKLLISGYAITKTSIKEIEIILMLANKRKGYILVMSLS